MLRFLVFVIFSLCCSAQPWESADSANAVSLLQHQIRFVGKVSLDNGSWPGNLSSDPVPALRGKGPRVIFVAGLEGSGHHLLTLLWQELQWWGKSLKWLKVKELSPPRSSTWNCESEWSHDDVAVMTAEFQKINQETDTVWVLPLGYLSYPCGNGTLEERRDKFYPHVDWIAEAAKAGGVDLSVLYLHRPIEDLLASSCLHRQFGDCKASTKIIAANGRRLADQIGAVLAEDIESVQCLEFGDRHAVTRAVLRAMGFSLEQVRLNRAIHKLWEPCSTDHSQCGNLGGQVTCCGVDSRATEPGWPELVQSLQPTEDLLTSVCDQSARLLSGKELVSGPSAQELTSVDYS